MPLLVALLIFASIVLFIGASAHAVMRRRLMKERLAKLMPEVEHRPLLIAPQNKWQALLGALGRKLGMKQEELFQYRQLLTAGGFRKESLYVFLGIKLLLAVALPAGYLALVALPHGKVMTTRTFILAACCAASGFLLPTFFLRRRVAERKTEIFHTLPDVLDLLTVSVEAGLNLDAALIKTAENAKHKDNPLIKEIEKVILEVRAGKPRGESLKEMATRTMVEDISSLVTMLVQTEKFGTSLGRTLRTFSDSLRVKRKQVAEEAAAKTATKMLFPLVFFIFPALLVVLLVPAFIKILAVLKPQ